MQSTSVGVVVKDTLGEHSFRVVFTRGGERSLKVDGKELKSASELSPRPLLSVFLPDRLALVKGPPALRRGHLDALIAAIWPLRGDQRKRYGKALAQRNSLLRRYGSAVPGDELDAWDVELVRDGMAVVRDRREVIDLLNSRVTSLAKELGVVGDITIRYSPTMTSESESENVEQVKEARQSDLERGYTTLGPHRDTVDFVRDGRSLRTFASQGEQRLTLLALLIAERELVSQLSDQRVILLLDDVMSELDKSRRSSLIKAVMADEGQVLITTTDLEHIPPGSGYSALQIADGKLESQRTIDCV